MDVTVRLEVLARVVEITRNAGIPDESLYIDPLVMTIATNTNAGNIIFETIRCIRAQYPTSHMACGLSNVSFGLPVRSLINRTFLALALAAGLDRQHRQRRRLAFQDRRTRQCFGPDRHLRHLSR